MALFQNPTIDAGLWRGPDIAGGLLGGYLNMQRARANDAFAADQQAQADQRRQALDEERNWQRAVQANPGEQGLAALYGVNTGRAMEYEKGLRELQNLRAQGGKLYQEGRKTSTEADKADTDLVNSEAIGAAHLLGALPPDQRNMQTLAPFLMSRAGFYRSTRPDIAAKLEQAAQSPDSITHIMAVAKSAGYKDPDEDMQRDLYKANAQAQFQNQLPPTPYQQQQLAQQGQQNELTQRQQFSDQQQKQAQWLIDKHDAAPETATYKRVLPKANAVLSAIQSTDPQSDVDIIYGLTNILDDLGSVREGDLAAVKGASSMQQWVDNLKSELRQQGRLGPEARKGIANIIGRRMKEYEASYMTHRSNLDNLARNRGLNPDELFAGPMGFAGQQGGQPPAPQAAPQQSGGAFREGQTATNKQTGQRMVYRGGQWLPL